MKKIFLSLIILVLCLNFVGCQKEKEDNNTNTDDGEKTNINNNVKPTLLLNSYDQYTKSKTEIYNTLNGVITKDNASMASSLVGFLSADVAFIPITMCGLGESERIGFELSYTDLEILSSESQCKVSYTTDGIKSSYDAIYDKKTDSIQIKIYKDEILMMINEHIKLDKGYASLRYYIDGDDSIVYKAIFRDDYIAVGYFENVKKDPTSIYKNKPNIEWTKNGTNWTEYKDGKITTIPN